MLRVLAEGDLDTLMASQLRIARAENGVWRALLPVRVEAIKAEATGQFRDVVKLAYREAAEKSVGREADQGFSVSLEGTVSPLEAALALALASGVSDEEKAAATEAEQMLATTGSADQTARVMADVIRQGRDVRTAGAHHLGNGQLGAFLIYTDDPEDYGSVSAYLRRKDVAAQTFDMRAFGLGFARLWLEASSPVPASGALNDLAAILLRAREAGLIPAATSDLVVISTGDTAIRVYCHTPETIAEAPSAADHVAAELEPVQPLDVAIIPFKADATASAELRDRIKALSRTVGYRVSLEPRPRNVARDAELEPLLEQIDELQHQIDQITALGAPQQRLLRFSDAQLPAMIDGLRKLPPKALSDGALQYAASHSAGRVGPAHYLMYNPTMTHMRVAEAYWRMRTEPHPMSYWLEPFVAEAQAKRPTRTQVFVPSGHFLVPSLAHFGGDVDETLRLVLGNLFDDRHALLTDKESSAFYIFSRSQSEAFDLDVEVVDGDQFAPLNQKLFWINDYLQMRSPVAVDPERLAEVAANLYEGEAAKALGETIDNQIGELDTAWAKARDDISGQALGVIDAIAEEMEAVTARISDLHEYLGKTAKEMQALETTASAATRALRDATNAIMSDLGAQDSAVAQARLTFEARMHSECRLAEDAIEKGQERISALQDRLRRIQTWGDG
ncbi:hypothetical protein N7U68_03820 [Roseovarius pelagicus]|uniref:Uncharacterized protein n=1 Tax=Roseovarius pelagicus TaxID=2980108 RepID=A0ABY6DCH0_9RHOB|nr:hypothetical protein N7U68_03820 [Roseovarius pelagicus]